MEPIIKVENLSKKYRIGKRESYYSLRDKVSDFFDFKKKHNKNQDFWALKDINFEVKAGESVGIIGRNGAGKSTLLKILSQITPPTTGKIILKGRVASLLEVGTGFNPELTGRENIYLNGAILGMTRAEIKRKFDEIVAFAEVEQFLDTPVKRYSSGMYMRLAFAVAAHLESEILIVDEVLAVGDAQFQKKCLGKMDDVAKKEGRTVLFVSHNMSAIQQLCKKSVLLNKGELLAFDTTQKIVKKYQEDSKSAFEIKESIFSLLDIKVYGQIIEELVKIGGKMTIDISLKLNENLNTQIGVEVVDSTGQNIFWLYPFKKYYKLRNNVLYNYKFVVDEVNLYPGSYHVGLWFGTEGNTIEYYKDGNLKSFEVCHSDSVEYFNNFNPFSTKVFQKFKCIYSQYEEKNEL